MEAKPFSNVLRYTFLVHAIVGTVVGLGFLLVPLTVADITSLPVQDDVANRAVGAAILGFAVSSWLGYVAQSWAAVKIVVQMEIAWTVLGTLVFLYYLVVFTPRLEPAGWGWVFAVILALFAIAFGYAYYQESRQQA